ncbi:uncharacterized protein PGTG_10899 [Puccinia graminis f. sp. tritici CRL 75-36-700-3]|uniref:Uncharacterized protein n=2 Tax=Puccinia graminis f. sp. tritici TaxID=56615 RepID=E3KKB5_PUCGT|nr:uncharacterized protein PGTG_10899 [Puccinia graminis f. sp. tritici CRL 75-36-700-3]EFP84740.1 hypothetical protein PGTG_10899 [Puccinia graminis f. sp. tritici CRL 75-36-700-3]
MFITKSSVCASFLSFTVLTLVRATPFPSDTSGIPSNGPFLATRGLSSALISGSSYGPLHKRESHVRRALPANMGKEIQNLKNNMTDQSNRLSVLHNMALPKSLKKSQAKDVNQKIEDILTIGNYMKDFCKAIVAAFPNNVEANNAMNDIENKGKTFGRALTDSKRPVGGDGRQLPGNIEIAQAALVPVQNARNILIRIASQ